jgi:uncharacterized membrane protein YqgA involved in biofilm formation
VTGAILNAAGILIGSVIGLVRATPLSAQTQAFFKTALGVFCIFFGLRLTWLTLNGNFSALLKQLVIVGLAFILGRWLGRLLHLQRGSNRAGQYARRLMEEAQQQPALRFNNGLNACAILFCLSPLGILGALQDGLPGTNQSAGYFYPLALKGVMDGLAMMSFVRMFGAGTMLAAFPVLLLQGTITLVCALYLEPFLRAHGLVDALNAAGGLLVSVVGLVIFEFKRVELADYLPAVPLAAVITWLWS